MNMQNLIAVSNKVVELNNQLTAVTEQRDRMAEALRPFIAGWCDKSCDSVVTERQFRDAKQALADLALAAVKGEQP
jgi:hypothetical protein